MFEMIFALGALEKPLTAMNKLVHLQVVGLSGRVVALVAVAFLFQISSSLGVEIFCPFCSWVLHVLALSPQYRNRV